MRQSLGLLTIMLLALMTACTGGVARDDRGASFCCDSLSYRVEFYGSSIVRILVLPEGDTLTTKRLVRDETLEPYTQFSVAKRTDGYLFETRELAVSFDRKSHAFSFVDPRTGEVLLSEPAMSRTFVRDSVGGEACLRVTQRFTPAEGEALYGLGQYQTGAMNYRGDTAVLLQANMDIVNPFLISTKGYGILWDNYSQSLFCDDASGSRFVSEVADAADYYFIAGQNADSVVAGYRHLTGSVPMFPKWAFGFWQSRERYKSFDELESVVAEYRRRGIPIDNIVQDWEYWGDKPMWNSLSFDTLRFPNAEQTIDRLHEKYNVRLMLSVWPGFGPQTEVYADLEREGALFDEPTWAGYKVFDAYNPAAREIFWSHMKKGLFDKGVDAWWMDATEPSFREGFTQTKQTEKFKGVGQTHLGAVYRYLNVYSLELSRFLYAKLREAAPERRPFILTRSAFAGQQRFGTAVWSGDVEASWDCMHRQIAAGLNLSFSGIPYWTSDTGGFFVTERDGQYPKGLADPEYRELYTRWFQFGTFTPLQRAHGTNVPREVWQFGEPGTPYYDTQVRYIELRYRLMPYIYSVARMVSDRGYTMMRGLAFDFAADPLIADIDNSYMFGPSLLVRPVTEPAAKGTPQITQTYLPVHDGGVWYDFHTGKPADAGTTHALNTPLEVMPLYVRGGSIIPMGEVKQYTMQCADSVLTINVYRGANAKFSLYDDAGDGYGFEKGEYAQVDMSWDETTSVLSFEKRHGSYPEMAKVQRMKIVVWSADGSAPRRTELIYDGSAAQCKL